jgi:hypothetical protein
MKRDANRVGVGRARASRAARHACLYLRCPRAAAISEYSTGLWWMVRTPPSSHEPIPGFIPACCLFISTPTLYLVSILPLTYLLSCTYSCRLSVRVYSSGLLVLYGWFVGKTVPHCYLLTGPGYSVLLFTHAFIDIGCALVGQTWWLAPVFDHCGLLLASVIHRNRLTQLLFRFGVVLLLYGWFASL